MKRPLSTGAACATFCAAVLSGCYLDVPADEYAFRPKIPLSGNDTSSPNNVRPDLGPPAEPPLLIFTELLIDAPGEDPQFVEKGEYIEIKNLGPGPADPRNITMFLTNLDQPLLGAARIEVPPPFGNDPVYEGLQLIQPGQYFVFIRHEDPEVAPISAELRPGSTYDFGQHAFGPTLPHQAGARRSLEIGYRYPNGETEIFDLVAWAGLELRDPRPEGDGKPMSFAEGQALALDENSEDPDSNDNPENWCRPPDLVGQVRGTPGRRTTCP